MSAVDRLPGSLSQLAQVAGSEAEAAEIREAAWSRLQEHVFRLAVQIDDLAGCPDLVMHSCAHVRDRLAGFDPSRGRFESWCRILLFRLCGDLRRRRSHQAAPLASASSGKEAATAELFVQRLQHLRQLLDRVGQTLSDNGQAMGYRAILLLQLRLELAARVVGVFDQPRPEDAIPLSEGVALCLPWRPGEEHDRFQDGWPSLATIWKSLATCLDSVPHRITVQDLCHTLVQLCPRAAFTPEVWGQWVSRTRHRVRCRVSTSEWNELLADLLGDHRDRRPRSCDQGESP